MQQRERFASLRYRVDKRYDKPLNEVFPELFKHDEFKRLSRKGKWEELACYICLLYDYRSDLLEEYPSDLKARKEAAAITAGFERDKKGEFPKRIQDVMDMKDEDATNAILRFLKVQKHQVWVEIVVCEEELQQYQKIRFKALDEKDEDIYGSAKKKDTLLEASEKRRKQLKELYTEFYGDNKDVLDAEFEEMISPETAERILVEVPGMVSSPTEPADVSP